MPYVVTHRVLDLEEVEDEDDHPEAEASWGYCDFCHEGQAPPTCQEPRCCRCGGWLLATTYV